MFSASKTSAPAAGGFQIANSLRFRSSASAYFNRTPSVAGNRQTWTWSGWVKRGALSDGVLFHSPNATSGVAHTWCAFSSNAFNFYDYTGSSYNFLRQSTQVFRDPSAWYHFVFVVDSNNATAQSRAKIYVNGSEITNWSSTSTASSGFNTAWNSAQLHQISSQTQYFDGYMAEINFIDGQALTPSYFGETSSTTGVWIPKKYTGSYGTNGFYLNFSNGTSTTTLGYDSSSNGNNWTTNNISLTTGSTYDWMIDSPTSYAGTSYGVGNYAVLNPLDIGSASSLNSGNLNFTSSSASGSWYQSLILSNFAVSSGKWYWEISPTSLGGIYKISTGICNPAASPSFGTNLNPSYSYWAYDGSKFVNGTNSAYGATWGVGDIVGVALDLDTGTLTFYKNGVSQGVAATGVSGSFIATASTGESGQTHTGWFNFGQRPFAYTPPSGYKSLCTQNLPNVSIYNGAQYMAATTYTGNGTSQAVTSVGFTPDFTWIKQRNGANQHNLMDINRIGYRLRTDDTAAEQDSSALFSFATNGFNLLSSNVSYNGSGSTYVAWNWKAGGTAVTNTAGSITSSVSANTTAGFSVVTYTGTGSAATVGHGLSTAPAMVIAKRRNSTGDWCVWHSSIYALYGAAYIAFLNTIDQALSQTSVFNGNTTATTFPVQTNAAVNASGGTYVAYCFAPIAGYSAFGSYTGNGSTDGPFVYCGFRPRYVLVKRTDASDNWYCEDSTRGSYNANTYDLFPNLSNAEQNSSSYSVDFVSNGFKIRTSDASWNQSGGTWIFAAFAENPFQNALAR
jgi:hypothetical protein